MTDAHNTSDPGTQPHLPTRYFQLIEEIVQATLQGKVRSKEQVYQTLSQRVDPGTGEIFERCLADRIQSLQQQADTQTDELKLAKANRALRALQTMQSEWQRFQADSQASNAVLSAAQKVLTAEPQQRLLTLVHQLDPNQPQPLTSPQLKQLAKALQAQNSATADPALSALAAGLTAGMTTWHNLEGYLTTWIYDQGQAQLGFAGLPGQSGPWSLWGKHVQSPLLQSLFQALSLNQPVPAMVAQSWVAPGSQQWIELTVVLQLLQRSLVAWFDKMVYDAKLGAKLSISGYLVFAVIWSQLATGLGQSSKLEPIEQEMLVEACLQMTLQILRVFSQQPYFPLYGGIFASFTGDYLQEALRYLDEPLRREEGTQEKARIFTILGYSLRTQNDSLGAVALHQQALELAREANDRYCEIANLNHLSRTAIAEKDYPEAISYAQYALMLSRQTGDQPGEANALANLGYSEVLSAQAAEATPETYEMAVHYLQQGLRLSEQTSDRQSQALCSSSLGIAYVIMEQPQVAVQHLEAGWQAAQFSGDFYLQGLNLAYLAQAYYQLQNLPSAILSSSLGMYVLEQIAAQEWRQVAGLLTIIQGQMGAAALTQVLRELRSQLLPLIGVDGYDYIPQLLQQYQDSLSE